MLGARGWDDRCGLGAEMLKTKPPFIVMIAKWSDDERGDDGVFVAVSLLVLLWDNKAVFPLLPSDKCRRAARWHTGMLLFLAG